MGRPRVKQIDDNNPELDSKIKPTKKEQEVKSVEKSKGKQEDNLIAKLNEELGIEEPSDKTPENTSEVKLDAAENTSEVEIVEKKPASTIKHQAQTSNLKHPTSKKIRSKKYIEAVKTLEAEIKPEDSDDTYSYKQASYKPTDAIDMVKKLSYSKFKSGPGTLEAHINTNQAGVRGLVSLPFAEGKKIRILAFPSHTLGTSDKADLEKDGVLIGDDSTLDTIQKGKIDFDSLITTPEWMPKLAKVAKNLGPKGLMPSPKNGTITEDIKKTAAELQGGKTEYKSESKAKLIHLGLGSLNQPTDELSANLKILFSSIGKSKIKKITLSPTMGPAVKLDLSAIV